MFRSDRLTPEMRAEMRVGLRVKCPILWSDCNQNRNESNISKLPNLKFNEKLG
jgi:hypothetical protein